MSYSIILPTLNEEGHIVSLIKNIINILRKNKSNYEIIVVDDNSKDGTINEVTKILKKSKNLTLLIRKNKKKNLAASINEGIKKSKFDYVIWLDADFQHPPKYIKNLIQKSKSNDVVICSRFLKKSKRYFQKEKNKKDINENQSVFYNKLCKIFLFSDISDYTSGFICIKKKLISNYLLNGYYGDYFLNLICFLKIKKNKICEIPFEDSSRATGKSKTVVDINFKYIYTCVRYFFTLVKNIYKVYS